MSEKRNDMNISSITSSNLPPQVQIISLNNLVGVLTLVVLALTLYYIIKYTKVTVCLWKEAKLSRELSISPWIIVKWENDKFHIKNAGNSLALNIEFDNFTVDVIDTGDKYELRFDSIDVLEQKAEKEMVFKTYKNNQKLSYDILSAYLDKRYENKESFTFAIKYTNVIGNRYETIFSTGKDGFKVESIKKL